MTQFVLVHCAGLILWLLLLVFLPVNYSVCQSVTLFLPPFLHCISSIHIHIHIVQVPLGKQLSLAVNSSMLSLAVDPKGNIMNNEQSRVRVGGGAGWLGGGRGVAFRTRTERWREGKLLVFTHQLGRRGDMKKWRVMHCKGWRVKSVPTEEREIRHQRWGGKMRVGGMWTQRGRVSKTSETPASSYIYHPVLVLSANTTVPIVHVHNWHPASNTLGSGCAHYVKNNNNNNNQHLITLLKQADFLKRKRNYGDYTSDFTIQLNVKAEV